MTVLNPHESQGKGIPLGAKRLSWEEQKERRAKGLCYNCDQVYKPRGHICLKPNQEGEVVNDKEFESKLELADKVSVMLLSSLPEKILVGIFLKLPVDSILACRCVCKVWRSLLCSPNFIKTHLRQAKPKLMLNFPRLENYSCLFRSVDYASISSALPTTCTYDWDVPWYYDFRNMRYGSIKMLGSCNGLICMALNYLERICIWNPSTGEYRETPLPSVDFFTGRAPQLGHVFYYDCIADDYKLVRIAANSSSRAYQVDFYALGSKSWSLVRTIESINHYTFPVKKAVSAVFVNGALHWTGVKTIKRVDSIVIVSFDVRSERFVDLFFPKEVQPLVCNTYECTLGILEDCLSLGIYHQKIHRIDVWLKQEYSVSEPWTKRFSFSTTNLRVVNTYWQPLWCLTTGELLIDFGIDKLLYDPKNNGFRALISGANEEYTMPCSVPLNYVESLVSPNCLNSPPPQGNGIASGAKRLSWVEQIERREKGLCYNCDEVYKPGHLCVKSSLLFLKGGASGATIKELDQGKTAVTTRMK